MNALMRKQHISRHPVGVWSAILLASLILFAGNAQAVRIKDLCEVQGARGNQLIGIGIVSGLAGTGDKTPAAVTALQRAMERMGVGVDSIKDLKSDNAAVVTVMAELPAFAKEGTRIDVMVQSAGNCKSLEGGTLLPTYLRSVSGGDTVYAVSQGALSIGGLNGQGGGGTGSRKNHATAGRIPMGAYVEAEAPSTITDGERLMLLLKHADFMTADNIQDVLNMEIEPGCASAFGAGTVSVKIPEGLRGDLVSFIARLQELEVKADDVARVVINERTGTVVVGGQVNVKPCQIAHGNLSIKVPIVIPAATAAIVSPTATPIPGPTTDTLYVPQENFLSPMQGASAGSIADALNKLKVTPRDMIAIFQALREAGALEADLQVM